MGTASLVHELPLITEPDPEPLVGSAAAQGSLRAQRYMHNSKGHTQMEQQHAVALAAQPKQAAAGQKTLRIGKEATASRDTMEMEVVMSTMTAMTAQLQYIMYRARDVCMAALCSNKCSHSSRSSSHGSMQKHCSSLREPAPEQLAAAVQVTQDCVQGIEYEVEVETYDEQDGNELEGGEEGYKDELGGWPGDVEGCRHNAAKLDEALPQANGMAQGVQGASHPGSMPWAL